MELKEFIAETLTNIVEGVELANKKQNRFLIAGMGHSGKGISGETVDFDVSITSQNKTEKDAKGKLGIFIAEAQVGGSKESHYESINHIKFKIFISEALMNEK